MPPPNETKRKRKTTELTIPRNEPGYILGYGKEAYDKKNYTLYDLKSAYIEHADDDEDTAHLKGDVYKYMGGSKCMPRIECEWSASIYLPDVREVRTKVLSYESTKYESTFVLPYKSLFYV